MIDIFVKDLENYASSQEKLMRLRELLQLLILSIIYSSGYFQNICFLGGTALRIVHALDRFSEDLDFSLANKGSFSFETFLDKLEREIKLRGFDVEIKRSRSERAVKSCFLKFSQVLFDTNLSPLKDQKIMIKLEIDENSPQGFKTELKLVKDIISFQSNTLDLSSLFAGKTHALIRRRYTKGRDFYDLQYYLARYIEPNYNYLNNALKQDSDDCKQVNNYSELCSELRAVIDKTDFNKVKDDIEGFVLDKSKFSYFDKEFFLSLINQYEARLKWVVN